MVTAVTETGLVETHAEIDRPTIFALTNVAFAAISVDALGALLEDKRALCRGLLRHVAFGQITSADLTDGEIVRTIGGRLVVDFSNAGVSFNGYPLVEADLNASNCFIHIVGGIIPPFLKNDEVLQNQVHPLSVLCSGGE